MGWISKILGKRGEKTTVTTATTHTIAFNELDDWFANESKKELDEFFGSVARIMTEIGEAKEQLAQDTKVLGTAEPSEAPPRVLRMVTVSRDNLIKQINALIGRINIPAMGGAGGGEGRGDADYSSVMDFYRSTDASIETTLERSMKSHTRTKHLFPKETTAVVSDIRTIKELLTKLKDLLDLNGSKIESFETISGEIRRINEIQDELARRRSELDGIASEIRELEQNTSDQESQLLQLEESDEWVLFTELDRELNQLKQELGDVETSTTELFMPLGKALNRMKKQNESGRHTLSEKDEIMLVTCLEDPISACASDVSEFMVMMLQLVESGALGLTDKKRDKIIDQIKQITDSFASKKDRYDALNSGIVALGERKSDLAISRTKAELEKGIADSGREIVELEERAKNLSEEVERGVQELEDLKKSVSDAVSLIGQVQVVFD
ncbi:MAG TPA: hypothetical protein ENF24_01160 [Methanosarcinales archaeon]|nr:hypothetical protein [Methanosarcinales archaeon]